MTTLKKVEGRLPEVAADIYAPTIENAADWLKSWKFNSEDVPVKFRTIQFIQKTVLPPVLMHTNYKPPQLTQKLYRLMPSAKKLSIGQRLYLPAGDTVRSWTLYDNEDDWRLLSDEIGLYEDAYVAVAEKNPTPLITPILVDRFQQTVKKMKDLRNNPVVREFLGIDPYWQQEVIADPRKTVYVKVVANLGS